MHGPVAGAAALVLYTATFYATVVSSYVVRGVRPRVLSLAEFAVDPETFACCAIAGSQPLDTTLKQFLTWSSGFFVEAGAYDGLQQVFPCFW